LTSKQLQDLEHYKDYFAKLASSFAGTATSITIPEIRECWKREQYCYWNGTQNICNSYSYNWDVFDPSYNTSETVGCDFPVYNSAITMTVKFSALFDITNLRNLAPIVIWKNVWTSYGGYGLYSFPDDTLGGVFPGGIQKSWFDRNTADWGFSFELYDAQNNPIDCRDLLGSTLTVSGKTFTAKECGGWWVPEANNVLSFYNDWWNTLPTSADVITVNEMICGTNVTLNVPGYQPKTIAVANHTIQKVTLSKAKR
jgi:hypothetical protein